MIIIRNFLTIRYNSTHFFLSLQSFLLKKYPDIKQIYSFNMVKLLKISVLFFILLIFSCRQNTYAQLTENLFTTDRNIYPHEKGVLSIDVDNLSFYKNNEFDSKIVKGYTLPGFWLHMKAVYNPLSNLRLELGAHSVWFFGATRYPAFAYKGISVWNGNDYSNNVHVLPFYRANLALSENVNVIIGNIYGGSNHRLIEPLYNPELNLTSDPETGLQLLYKTKWLDLDLWIDWMTFIYNLDTHQESFVSGASAQFNLNSPDSRFHAYLPVQGIVQHKGGEINVSTSNVQTIMNGAVGAGLVWNVNNYTIKNVNVEFDVLGYIFPKGNIFEKKHGKGYYLKTAVQIKDFTIKTSYWSNRGYMPIYGNIFYGAREVVTENVAYNNPSMFNFGADYALPLGKGFAFGINADMYYCLPVKAYRNNELFYSYTDKMNYSMGVYLRVNPSFFIKRY